jgi:hypothetical protein
MAITLTQDSYRLWARIGESKTFFGVQVTDSTSNVAAQLAQMLALNIAMEGI